jgi:TRAP-type C4-dicarboxylate transport system permease small subunit
MHPLERTLAPVNRVFAFAAAMVVLFMMLSIVYDVVARAVFGAPTVWVLDFNEYALVFLTFIPAGGILLRGGHVRVEIVTSRLTFRGQRRLDILSHLLGVIYCAILAWQGASMTWAAWQRDYRFSTALEFPQYPVLGIIPAGSIWLAVAFAARAWILLTSPKFATSDVRRTL